MSDYVLDVRDLKTYFFTKRGVVKAVDGVTFGLKHAETLGLVGESGCGKTMTCLSILNLVPKPCGKIVGGQIFLQGDDLLKKKEREMRLVRGKVISMIRQDPMTSLDPVFTVRDQVGEPLRMHRNLKGRVLDQQIQSILAKVKIPSPEVRMHDYPHQLSGGMRQRVMGAMAISCQPKVLIADEPTTALDVTIQAQFLRLLKEIQRELGVSMIMITHDLGIVARVCERVAVMYAGKIVESGSIRDIFDCPSHPYTVALLNSIPRMEKRERRLFTISGQPPDLASVPAGCSFASRCQKADARCGSIAPPSFVLKEGHSVSCWLAAGETA